MQTSKDPSELLILWASGEKETALHMVFLYGINCIRKGWWDEVTLLVWGAATRLAAEDAEIQAQIAAAREMGLRVIGCKRCAEKLEVVETLQGFGVDLFYTGEYLTEWIQSGKKMLTV